MPNPLRLPIVLIAIFSLMLYYVHQHHLRHAGEKRPFRPLFEQEHLQLRQPLGPGDRATVLGPLSIGTADVPRATSDIDPSQPDRSPAAARLPSLDERRSPTLTQDAPRATLWPPTSAYSRLAEPAPPPTDNVASRSAAPAAPAAQGVAVTPAEVMHRIVDGDTLPELAQVYLGDASRYPELLEANRDVLVRPDLLPLGVRIRIPVTSAPD